VKNDFYLFLLILSIPVFSRSFYHNFITVLRLFHLFCRIKNEMMLKKLVFMKEIDNVDDRLFRLQILIYT